MGRERDPGRSRRAIIEAAEVLFAERGFAGASLEEIGRVAGVARATPSYFFGSKDALYREVLALVLRERDQALRTAFAPLLAWARSRDGADSDHASLRAAISAGIGGYLAFLDTRPTFARLIEWEALTGASALSGEVAQAGPISQAFRAAHRVRRSRRLADFDPTAVVVAVVSLCFLPVAHADTFRAGGEIDTLEKGFRTRYETLVVDAVLHMMLSVNAGQRRR